MLVNVKIIRYLNISYIKQWSIGFGRVCVKCIHHGSSRIIRKIYRICRPIGFANLTHQFYYHGANCMHIILKCFFSHLSTASNSCLTRSPPVIWYSVTFSIGMKRISEMLRFLVTSYFRQILRSCCYRGIDWNQRRWILVDFIDFYNR